MNERNIPTWLSRWSARAKEECEIFKGLRQSHNPFAVPKGKAFAFALAKNCLQFFSMSPHSLRKQTKRNATYVSNELSSRSVSRQVLLPLQSLTSVFGMGTGGPSALKSLTSRLT